MNIPQPSEPGPKADDLNGVSDVYDLTLVATSSSVRDMLARRRSTLRAPVALALRSIAATFDANVQGAIGLLNLAEARASDETDKLYLRDMLLTLLCSMGDFSAADRLFGDDVELPQRHAPGFVASRAVVRAAKGELAASRVLSQRALAMARSIDSPPTLGRALHRCALAAYYRGDYEEAREVAFESVPVLAACGAYPALASSYSITAAIAQCTSDAALAATHYAWMLDSAERCGNNALRRVALAGALSVASESNDREACDRFRNKVLARPDREQQQENFGLVVSDVLWHGGRGDLDAAEAALNMYSSSPRCSGTRAATVEAFLSLTAAARWNVELARIRSRSALRQTAALAHAEPLHDHNARRSARLLAAAACFVIGDTVRGQRALSARFDSLGSYAVLLAAPPIDFARCPELFRGYAGFINVVAERARAARPQCRLTAAELEILRALPHGATMSEIALELNKSKSTVARQVESIYEKLGAHNRAHAVQIARERAIV